MQYEFHHSEVETGIFEAKRYKEHIVRDYYDLKYNLQNNNTNIHNEYLILPNFEIEAQFCNIQVLLASPLQNFKVYR